jgi:hypothetical protein
MQSGKLDEAAFLSQFLAIHDVSEGNQALNPIRSLLP